MKKTLVLSMMLLLTPFAAMANDEDYSSSAGMTNEEARSIAKSPEYAELSHRDTTATPSSADTDMAAGSSDGSSELPRTASVLPLLALIGSASAAGAAGVRRARR